MRTTFLLFLVAAANLFAQDLPLGVIYTCGGERLYLENCNIRDTSDNSTCMVAHPDRPQHNGFMAYTTETRGALKKLLPTCQRPSAGELAKAQAHYKKQNDLQAANEKKANDEAATIEARAQAVVTGKKPQTPEQRAITRCISSGRLPASCTGNALLGAFGQMLSQVVPSGDAKPPTAGPIMAGVFQGAGNWRLDFIDGGVLVNCSFLSPDQRSYKLEFGNNRTSLVIDTTPKPLVLALRSDGTIAGPGPLQIDGVVAAGYVGGDYRGQNGQHLNAGEAANHDGPVYDAAGNRAFNPTPGHTVFSHKSATCPAPNLSSKGASTGIQTMQTDLLKGMFGGDKGPPTPPGIRMNGIFAAPSTGFSVQFFPESAILGCGPDVARAYAYTVTADGTKALVHIEAPDHPLTFTFNTDGSLEPNTAGPYQVHGRTVTGQNDNDDFTFAPRELACNLAHLTASATIPASGGIGTATTSVVANSGGSGGAFLSIVSAFPATPRTPNPLAGHPYVLLRDSYADALAKGGISVPSSVSPYKYVTSTCASGRTPDCQKIIEAIKAATASAARADANGTATLPGVPPGNYYLMISARYNNQPLVWGQAVQLRVGPNSLTLDQRNATPMN